MLHSWSGQFVTAPSTVKLKHIHTVAPGPYGTKNFQGGYTEWGHPDGTPLAQEIEADQNPNRPNYPRAAEVYFNAVRQQTPTGDFPAPFTVHFEAVLDAALPDANFDTFWYRAPGSLQAGELVFDRLHAQLRFDNEHPPIPGLYKIYCEVYVNGENNAPITRHAVAYVLLPFAGPDVQDWIINEARQIVDGAPNYPGVGEQWVLYMLDETSITIPNVLGIGAIIYNPFRRVERAFSSVSAFYFDYTQIMFLQGLDRPTGKYSYTMSESGVSDPDRTDHVNFPAYATIDNRVVVRGRINVLLWTVWAKAVFHAMAQQGFDAYANENDLILEGGWWNNLGKAIKKKLLGEDITLDDFFDDSSASDTGINLYNAIRENRDDAWIKEHVLTPASALAMQTNDPIVYDRVLWPRPDYSASPNMTPWIGNTGLTTQNQFDRPHIFRSFDSVDLNPWTASQEDLDP
jgi:hypothetical protein